MNCRTGFFCFSCTAFLKNKKRFAPSSFLFFSLFGSQGEERKRKTWGGDKGQSSFLSAWKTGAAAAAPSGLNGSGPLAPLTASPPRRQRLLQRARGPAIPSGRQPEEEEKAKAREGSLPPPPLLQGGGPETPAGGGAAAPAAGAAAPAAAAAAAERKRAPTTTERKSRPRPRASPWPSRPPRAPGRRNKKPRRRRRRRRKKREEKKKKRNLLLSPSGRGRGRRPRRRRLRPRPRRPQRRRASLLRRGRKSRIS